MYSEIGKGVCEMVMALAGLAALGLTFLSGFLWWCFFQMLTK